MKSTAVLPVLASLAGFAAAAPVPESAVTLVDRSWAFLNEFLAELADIFPVSIAIQDISDIITGGEQVLADFFDIQTTENGSDSCTDVTVLFARGTTETGNVGVLAGPPFFDSLSTMLGSSKSLSIQGVDYPASVEGYLNGDAGPGETMASDITSILSSCPDTQLVLSGYSQGAALVHNAAADVSSAMSQVAAIVTFGDPDSTTAVAGIDASKVLVICHAGDNICEHGDLVLLQHLTYAENADQAASFVVSQL